MSTQALSVPISSLSLLLVQTQAVRWKAATPDQLTGAHLYLDIANVRLLLSCSWECYEWLLIHYNLCIINICKLINYPSCVYFIIHYNNIIMSAMASQITSFTIVYSPVYSRLRSKKTWKLCVTVLCAGNSPVTGEFPAQRASNAENVSIWWRHHAMYGSCW